MSYRDVVVTLTIVACLPYALLRPFFGLLLFSWLAYMRPQDLCWGFAKQWRFSLLVAIGMYVGWFFFETRKFTRWSTPMRWLIAFTICLTISLLANERLDINRPISKWFDLMKVFLVAFFTCGMVDDRKRLRMILWTITLSLGFYGVKFGLHGIIRGGRILQGPGGMMLDNNDLCLAMAMNLPLLFFMGRTVEVRWKRRVVFIMLALTCVTVVCTLSRGGFLTMCLAGGLILNNMRKRVLPWIVAGGLIGLTLIALPEDAKKRLATLENPGQESSAAGRLYAWQVGWQMVKANPFFGVGFEAFLSNFRKYDPNPISQTDAGGKIIVAHNTYVQVWAELGTLAAVSFLSMLASAILCLRKTRKLIARARAGPEFDELKNYADMIQISLICFMFGANFLNRAHFDLMYHLIALSTVVLAITRQELARRRLEESTPDEPEEGARAVLSRLPAYAGYR
jgi:probable O-glycosylation ligase (exosortase A-associated)